MLLSILIPTLPERDEFLFDLTINLWEQVKKANAFDKVEILTDSRDRSVTTGEKRNDLLKTASGKYVWHVDDDDFIYEYAIEEILKAVEIDPDVIGICGIMTVDGKNEIGWEIRLGHPYCATIRNGKEFYLRHPNHITPMKREIALKIPFPNKTFGEDYEWSKKLNDAGHLKTQAIIEKPLYHYRCRTKK